MLGNMRQKRKRKHIVNLFTFLPQRTMRQNTFLYCTVHIYGCILHFIFRAFLSFAPTQSWLVLSSFLITIPHYRSGGNPGMLLPPGPRGSTATTPFPQSSMSICYQVTQKRSLKCLGRRVGSASHPRYLLEQILHAVFLDRLSSKINASLFPTVSSNWHLLQPA